MNRRFPVQRPSPRGSILVIVMVTLVFAATALMMFLEKATNQLLVQSRVVVAGRLRQEAYSALEVALGVLEDFRSADRGLRSPNEGWGSGQAWGNLYNLPWVQWSPSSGRTVDLAFEDESAKLSLYHYRNDPTDLLNEFQYGWGMSQGDAQHLVDALLMWMNQNYVPVVASPPDYSQDPLPYSAPLRSPRSFSELAAIDYVKDLFFDDQGRPNALYWRFVKDFSLFSFGNPNINSANSDILTGLGQFSAQQVQNIADFMADKGVYATPTPLNAQWFTSASQITNVIGPSGNPGKFGNTISALRILITVHEGKTVYRLSVVVAPQGSSAKTIQTTATDAQKSTMANQAGETATNIQMNTYGPSSTPTSAQASTAAGVNVQFPFTILEIRENDGILTPPPSAS
jgi:general secretion pathway protein K